MVDPEEDDPLQSGKGQKPKDGGEAVEEEAQGQSAHLREEGLFVRPQDEGVEKAEKEDRQKTRRFHPPRLRPTWGLGKREEGLILSISLCEVRPC